MSATTYEYMSGRSSRDVLSAWWQPCRLLTLLIVGLLLAGMTLHVTMAFANLLRRTLTGVMHLLLQTILVYLLAHS